MLTISTSGNSTNILRAMETAKSMDIGAFAFLGKGGGKCKDLADEFFLVPSENTAAIQEAHITAGHALMEAVEDKLLGSEKTDE